MSDTLRHTWLSSMLAMLVLLFGTTTAHAAGGSYGKTLVKSYDVPLSDIARFERFNQSPTNSSGKLKTSTGLLPDTEDWVAGPISVSSSQNPYTIVVKTHGIATHDGEAELRWQPGWNREGTVQSPISIGTTRKVKANETVEIVTVSGASRFKEDQTVAPNIAFVKASNLRIDSVQVEVWSGLASPGIKEMFFSFPGLLTGLVFLGVVVWFRRK